MDVQAEKRMLIAWLAELNDAKTILEFISLKNKTQQDLWNEIGDEEPAEIEKGLAQADKDELVAHEEVLAKYKKWRCAFSGPQKPVSILMRLSNIWKYILQK